MKINLCFLLLMAFALQLTAQSYIDKKGNKQLWGKTTLPQIQGGEFEKWYAENYEAHETKLSNKDGKLFKDVKVKIFLGTWCGDTKYLLPRFIKNWEQMNLSTDRLEFIALHNKDENYKQGPNGETEGFNIHRVPTFIFEKDGKEIGRIVERTVFDLDTDMKTIAQGWPYQHRYKAVAMLDQIISETPTDSLMTKNSLNPAFRKVRREVSSSSELNTYGYTLLAQNKLKEAEFVFRINRFLFPFTPNVRDSYGEVLMKQERYEDAREQYYEVLRLRPEHENAIKQLAVLIEKINAAKES